MAKAKTPSIEIQNEDNIVVNSISQVMHDSMMPYSEYVILERALPRVEDGLKPVQRRILYTMKELGLDPEKPHRKSARIVGDTLGKYHPHGDTSVYDAMARMAQDFNMRETLVDGQGNFGSIDGDSPAAMRYTEARMTPLALEMLRDIEKESVPFRLNFDDTLKEPELLPARFPNLLVNGAMGIAVGFATDIPPHNLGEVIDGVCHYLDNPECSVDDLMKIIPAPDFPTGALILSDSEFDNVYKNGKGKIVMRAKTSFEAGPNGKKLIVISEIPFQMNKARMLERLAKLCEEKKGVLTNVTDIRDESDKNGLRAVIELKKDADEKVILNYLYKYSDLQVNYNANMVAIANGKPERLNLRSAIGYYAQHQKDVVLKRTKFDLAKALKDKHILEGLIKAVSIIEEVIATIRMSKSPSEARENLMKLFSFSREQAQAILDLRLQRLTNLEIVALKNEFKELCKHIAHLEEIISSPEALVRVVKEELTEIKEKYATPRKSKIIDANAKIEISEEDFIVAEDVTVIITRNQDIKVVDQKTVARSSSDIDDINVGAGDNVEYVIKTSTDKKLLLFTDMGSCYYLSPSAVPYSKWRDRGVPLSGVFTSFNRAEKIVGVYSTKTFDANKFVLMTTKNGTTKKTALDQFDASRSKVLAIDLVEEDTLKSVIVTDGKDDVLFISKMGMALRCANSDIGVMGRNSKGVRSMKLKDGDSICAVCEIHHDSGAGVALVTNNGSGKTVSASQIPCQKRAGGGFQILKFNKNGSNGVNLICAEYTCSADERAFTVQFEDSNTEKLPISSLPKMPAASAGKGLFDWLQEITRCFVIKG